MGTTPTADRAARLRRWTPWLLYLATLLSALPLGAIIARESPQPPGACSGIGFGCSLYGWDAAGFALLFLGVPYAVGLAVVLGLLHLVPRRLGFIHVGMAAIGLAVPWIVVTAAFR